MKCTTRAIRSGFDGEKCFVHARCCYSPGLMVATAQYLNVAGCDAFSGLYLSTSTDEGKTWTGFTEQPGLAAIEKDGLITTGSDATPLYHKKTGRILLLGHTCEYRKGELAPTGEHRYTFYSVFDPEKGAFSPMKFLPMPAGFERCGNGSGQSYELENGDLLIPVYYQNVAKGDAAAMVLRCSFDGTDVKLLEMGNSMTVGQGRGLGEGSVIFHDGFYWLTLRNDDNGYVAKSTDGLHYDPPQLWRWDDGTVLETYNTQQHWLTAGDELWLVYTRKGAGNDHVFRHRAPLFAGRVRDMKIVRESEIIVVGERGARLGNFGVTALPGGRAAVMAAEWMQPAGCEAYGSDNSVFLSIVEK